ncbi:MAG: hypothetical protein ACRC2T_16820 [Thermoguttaceae bacterium]
MIESAASSFFKLFREEFLFFREDYFPVGNIPSVKPDVIKKCPA